MDFLSLDRKNASVWKTSAENQPCISSVLERTWWSMNAFLILEDGHIFTGKSIGAEKEVISEVVFNTSMTGYLEVLTDPSYAGQAVTMTYPLIGNYGICRQDMESGQAWPDAFIVRELSRMR